MFNKHDNTQYHLFGKHMSLNELESAINTEIERYETRIRDIKNLNHLETQSLVEIYQWMIERRNQRKKVALSGEREPKNIHH